MEKIVYLKDGKKARLLAELATGTFVVIPYMEFMSVDGPYEDEGEAVIIVKEVFKEAPVEVIDERFKKAQKDLEQMLINKESIRQEIADAQSELDSIKRKGSQLNRLIVDRSELMDAERIYVFLKGEIEPKQVSRDHKKDGKIQFTFSVADGECQGWYCKYWGGSDSWGNANDIDMYYGFMINKTNDEMRNEAILRCDKLGIDHFREYVIQNFCLIIS